MNLILVAGKGGVGKHTIASCLSKRTGYRLLLNHLTANIALALFDLYSDHFADLRDDIWRAAIDRSVAAQTPGLVMTFALDPRLRRDTISDIRTIVGESGGRFFVVRITCADDENRRRAENLDRKAFGKPTNYGEIAAFYAQHGLMSDEVLQPDIVVEVTNMTPEESAEAILQAYYHNH